MATFTVDLLTGNIYLFNGNFSGSGSTPTTGSTSYPQVADYSALPPAGTVAGEIYVARQGYGTYVLNRKPAGFYFSTGVLWRYLGELPSDLFKSSNFQILDSVDNSKGIMFVTSGISTTTFRKLKVQNSDGTIAYLTDLNTKVDKTVFATYTGTTVPATYVSKTNFNTYTGTTAPNQFVSKSAFNTYTGTTLTLINTKQDKLTAGTGIKIIGNVISVTGTSITALQLNNVNGGIEVNNIPSTPIVWTTQEFSGTSLSFTGGSRIYIRATGKYEISYSMNVISQTNSPKNIGSLIRKNGNIDITPLTSTSNGINNINDTGTNVMPKYLVNLNNNDYLQLVAFRIGDSGSVLTKANGTWIRFEKK